MAGATSRGRCVDLCPRDAVILYYRVQKSNFCTHVYDIHLFFTKFTDVFYGVIVLETDIQWNYWQYFADGWPAEVISQTTIRLMGQSRLKQKQIVWDYRSVGNSR